VGDQGRLCIVGFAGSSLPVTPGAYDTSYNGDVADGFVMKLDASANIVFATYLGSPYWDWLSDVALDSSGRVFVIGYGGTGFPTTPGTFRARPGVMISVLDPSGSSLLYSTSIGYKGSSEQEESITVDALGTVYATGAAVGNFAITPNAFDTTLGGVRDAFVTKMRPGPILSFVGTPAPGQPVHYEVHWAASVETGNTALVTLSVSGTQGIPLPGGQVLPLTFDSATLLGIQLNALLQGTIDSLGAARTPDVLFPPAQPGLHVYSAAATWDPAIPRVVSVTPAIDFVTQ